ncbi:MAG TPA: LysM peptidoglycan-binding domain-containing protein [Verrucomicrobiae bacterium]|nr:LysM peptidoglycan-binding domain-containing protein [Verrucomicrobiae bacterium]
MKSLARFSLSLVEVACAALLLNGCATGPKRLQPVNEEQKSEFLKGMEVVEKPELEPEWADFVKEHYPNWRRHYWVDRGQWGNRGYIVGRPSAEAEPVVEAQITPLPPAAPAIVESEPPKVETPEKPTRYVVKRGDSLWRIAGKVYHNPLKWPRIYRANKDKITNPNKIYPNQVLVIPQD